MLTCQEVCSALEFLLDIICIRHGSTIFQQTVGIPIGINCATLIADLFLYCHERDFMLSLSKNNEDQMIEAFNYTSVYLDDTLNVNNRKSIFFHEHFTNIYPPQLNQANVSDTKAAILDISLEQGRIITKIYDKRDDFN